MSDTQKALDETPDYIRIRFVAETDRFLPDGTTSKDGTRRVVQFSFDKPGSGFGEITFVEQDGHLLLDTDRMGKEKVMELLQKLVDRAILDTDKDPERHAIYNRCFWRKCGEVCKVCHER